MRNVTVLLIMIHFLVGCSLSGSVLDMNALTPPVLTDALGERMDSFVINKSSDVQNVTVQGECFYENQDIQVSFVPENSSLAQHETRKFNARCVNNKFELQLDTQAWTDTSYKVVLAVTSIAGVSSSTEASVLKDIVAPVVSFTSAIAAEVGNATVGSIPVAGTCESEDGPVEIYSGAQLLSSFSCQSNGTFATMIDGAGLLEGSNVFEVKQKDIANNVGTATSMTFNKDTIAPLLLPSFGSLGSALSNDDTTRQVSVTLPSDGGTQYKYIIVKDADCSGQWAAVMAATPVAAGTDIPLSFSGDGTYRICALAGDQADNWASAAGLVESGAVVIDKTAPALTIATPVANSKIHSTFTLTGTCEAGLIVSATGDFTPAPSTQTCSVSGTYSMNLTLSAGDGAKNISVSTTDGAGNTTAVAFHSVTKDTQIVPPNVTMNTPVMMSAALAKFTVNNCSDHTMIMLKEQNAPPALGDAGWLPCSTAAQNYVFDLSATDQQGLRNVRFYARDEAGNISTATVFTITYDSKAPIMTLDAVPTLAKNVAYPFVVYVTEATVSATAVLSLQYSADGVTWNNGASCTLGLAGPMNNKSFEISWTPTSFYTGLKVRAVLTDDNGNTGYGESNLFDVVFDVTPPTILANQMKINGSLTPDDSVRSYVTVSLQGHDAETAVSEFCLKTTNTAPAASDACWVSVKAPKPGLEELPDLFLVDFDFFLGINFGTYNIYAWVKDVAGNISTNSATLKKDYNTVNYINDAPPVVGNFLAVNSTTPNAPPINTDMTFANGAAVYLKWKASDNGTITKVELYSSQDGSQYTLISDALANNSDNGAGCSYSAPHTGCYVWNSTFPNNTFFKLQLRFTDNYGQTSQVTSPPLNSGNVNLLAGNQDPGHNGNAKQTVFNTNVGNDTAPGSLLVTTDGKIFFNDSSYGLMYVDPKTNNSKVLLRLAKSNEDSYGDGIPVEQARAKAIYRATLDYQNRVLVYDRHMIRRIDTSVEPMTIETIIGADPAGNLGTNTADTVADPRDLKIDISYISTNDQSWLIRRRAIFQAHPNGDIYFVSDNPGKGKDNGGRIRVYKGSLAVPRVEAFRFSGTGAKDLPTWDLNTKDYSFFSLRYDSQTSDILKAYVNVVYSVPGNSYGNMTELDINTWIANGVHPNHPYTNASLNYYEVQSMDGYVYRANRATEHSLVRLNDNGTWTRVLGTGAMGECADGTAATSCAVSLDDAFVDRYGRIFFSTRGIIKTVYNGNVYTLFGQRKDAGDGGVATDMRLSMVYYLDHGAGDSVVILDHQQNKLREVSPGASPEVRLVAGNGQNGNVNFATAANAQNIRLGNWWDPNPFATNPTNGDIYMNCSAASILTTPPDGYTSYHSVCRLNRATGLWEELFDGQGATPSYTQATVARADLQLAGYSPEVVAYQGGNFLINQFYWNGTAHNSSHFRLVTPTTTNYVAGTIAQNQDGDVCPDGSSANCDIGPRGVHTKGAPVYYGPLSGWLFNPTRSSAYAADMHVVAGGVANKMLTLPTAPGGFAYDAGSIYYCSGGKVYKATITNAGDLTSKANWPLVYNTHFTVTELTMPTDNIVCEGRRILVKAASGPKPKRLVMMVKQNGLPAIIEYFLP
ncbi:hemagglutinin [Bdellovibrio bacteriovorus]|uniref:hemagglutinin n=1 Tax=Bdellovibrio bacteriovorus TaxID=959 RepID=UPI0035A737A5